MLHIGRGKKTLFQSLEVYQDNGMEKLSKNIEDVSMQRQLERVGWMSMGVNVLLILLNGMLGWLSGSIAVTAEAVHNLVDMVGSVAILIGLKLSRRKSNNFPYGLYKVENIVALIIAILIFLAGYEIAKEAIFSPEKNVEVTWPVLVGVIISLIIPVLFSIYELRIGRLANSPSIIADGEEFRMHALSSGAVLVGLIGQYFGFSVDRWASLFVVVFILHTGWELSRDAIRALLDASLDMETLGKVRSIIESDPLTVNIESLTGRNAGRYCFLEVELLLRTDDLKKAKKACDRLEAGIRREIPHVERVLIHLSPVMPNEIVCAMPVNGDGTCIDDNFRKSEYFFVTTMNRSSGETASSAVYRNPFESMEQGSGVQLGKWLVGKSIDCVMTHKDISGTGLGFSLSDSGIVIRVTSRQMVADVLSDLKTLYPVLTAEVPNP